ncbi:hypothetical protein J2766_005110 [Agrobacterium tumefaciens]|uniref:Uncharacterized protein n=1 Tax=Agrobacterium tumefaciens TaxID=358 RepID=A0AAW8M304_AGRTU|nr:hypothetical protein [Agrobacterium tumefaciens]MDR6705365.1 hypothetical protein [Agrobacterium tumefaciens]
MDVRPLLERIAKPTAFMSQRLHTLAKVMVIAAPGFVTDRHPAKADGFTRPPFAHLVVIHQMSDSFPPCCGRHHFFPKRSFKAALSSIESARSRFSFVFSSSSAFRRLASDTSMPSNLAFQLMGWTVPPPRSQTGRANEGGCHGKRCGFGN